MRTPRWRARCPHLLAAVVAGLAAGCAATQPTTTLVTPSPDELPNLAARRTDTQQALVRVEGRGTESRMVLAPDFKVPPLTASEKEALGQKEPVFQFLPYEYPGHIPGYPVAGWYASVQTRDIGWGGADASVWPAPVWTASAGIGGPAVGYDPRPQPVGDVQDAQITVGGAGPETRIRTRVGQESHVARQQPRRDK